MSSIPYHFLDLPSGRLAYRELGEGKPLLFLHGWGVDSSVFVPLMQKMSTYRRCIALDFPGFGGSEIPKTALTVPEVAYIVAQFMEHMKLETCDLLAHSFGGRVSLELLADHATASRFEKVLITGGAGMKPRRTWRFYYRKYLAKTLKAPFALLPGALRERGLEGLRKTSLWKSLGSSDYQNLQGVMRESFVKTVNYYQEALLPKINHSILLLWGENDDATPIYQAERLEKGLNNAALVRVARAGHYAFIDQPTSFETIARAYFTE
jgi:pimeloyl-ACP methyl ester carboxylesterase